MATFTLEPRENAHADIEVIVVIAEIEMAVSRTGEHIKLKCADIYPMEEIGEYRGRCSAPNQALGFKRLDPASPNRSASASSRRPSGTAQAIRLQRALQSL